MKTGLKFTISINGFGDTDEQCWENALNNIALFPPDQPNEKYVEEICYDCGMIPFKCMCSDEDKTELDGSIKRQYTDISELADKLYDEKKDNL